MYCSNCGNYMEDSASFCTRCGNPVAKAAPAAPQIAPHSVPQSAPQQVQPAKPFPVKHVIFAGAAAFLFFLSLVMGGGYSGVGVVTRVFSILAAGGMVTGLILRDQEKVSSIIFGASTFTFAFCAFLSLVSSDGFYIFTDMCVFAGYGLLGVYYILRGKIFGNPLKLIFTAASAGITSLALLVNFIQLVSWGIPAVYVFRALFLYSAQILTFAVIFFHTPYRNQK